MNVDVDVRKELYANVVPSGGTSTFPGAGECMKCAEALFQSSFTSKGASRVLDFFFFPDEACLWHPQEFCTPMLCRQARGSVVPAKFHW